MPVRAVVAGGAETVFGEVVGAAGGFGRRRRCRRRPQHLRRRRRRPSGGRRSRPCLGRRRRRSPRRRAQACRRRRRCLARCDEPGDIRPAGGELEHRQRHDPSADERQRGNDREPVARARFGRRGRGLRRDRWCRNRRCLDRRRDDARGWADHRLAAAGLEPAHLALDPAEPGIQPLPAGRDQVDQDGEVVDPLAPLGIGLPPQVANRLGQLAEDGAELDERGVRGRGRYVLRLLIHARDRQRQLILVGDGSRLGPFGHVTLLLEDVVERGEREALHGAGLLGREVVQHREHALLDRVADGLTREHAHDALDGDIRLLGDLDQNRHTGRVGHDGRRLNARDGQVFRKLADSAFPARFPGFKSEERAMLNPWTRSTASA